MSPVRGKGWYKRPYRLAIPKKGGGQQIISYHWPGSRDKDAEFYRGMGVTVRVWDEPYDSVVRRDA